VSHTSGPIDVRLVGGFYYAIGYFISGDDTSNYGNYEIVPISFGSPMGSLDKKFNALSLEGAPSGLSQYGYSMSLTTAAP
jgi:hypothetical protein